jgi:Transglycosylase-like domain
MAEVPPGVTLRVCRAKQGQYEMAVLSAMDTYGTLRPIDEVKAELAMLYGFLADPRARAWRNTGRRLISHSGREWRTIMMIKRKLVWLALLAPMLFGCTPREIRAWQAWHDQDPAAAEAFAASLPQQPAAQQSDSSGWSVNWDRVARCESGGQWSHGQVTNRVGTFSGGLMIMNSAWRQFGGQQFASIAGNATKAQQIIVAERIVARVGFDRAWQCHA